MACLCWMHTRCRFNSYCCFHDISPTRYAQFIGAMSATLSTSRHLRTQHVMNGRPSRRMASVHAFQQGSNASPKSAERAGQGKSVQVGMPARASGGYAVPEAKQPLIQYKLDLPAELPPQEVEIMVTHCGVCHSDLHMKDNDWFISKFPFIPGHEVIGEVRAVGSQVQTLRPGMRVGVGWMRDSCRRCPACIRGEENLCEPGYTGTIVMGRNGGFQSVLRVPAEFAFNIPDDLDSAAAAPLLCAGVTVFAPLKKYMTRPGMNVAILGVGGLGHLAVQFANVMGGVVTALCQFEDKKKEALGFGATYAEVYNEQLAESHKGRFDVILNCCSANLPTAPLLKMLKNDGVLVQVGIPGDKAEIRMPLADLVFGQKKVVGSIVGGRSDMMNMFHVAAAKGVKPMIEIMPSNKINEAFDRVKSGKARYRVVLEMKHGQDPALTME